MVNEKIVLFNVNKISILKLIHGLDRLGRLRFLWYFSVNSQFRHAENEPLILRPVWIATPNLWAVNLIIRNISRFLDRRINHNSPLLLIIRHTYKTHKYNPEAQNGLEWNFKSIFMYLLSVGLFSKQCIFMFLLRFVSIVFSHSRNKRKKNYISCNSSVFTTGIP